MGQDATGEVVESIGTVGLLISAFRITRQSDGISMPHYWQRQFSLIAIVCRFFALVSVRRTGPRSLLTLVPSS